MKRLRGALFGAMVLVAACGTRPAPTASARPDPAPPIPAPVVPALTVPTTYRVKPSRMVRIEATLAPGLVAVWDNGGADCDWVPFPPPNDNVVLALFPAPGTYRIVVATAQGGKPVLAVTTVVVEGPAPTPVPPGPTPVPPGPTPSPAPIPVDGFRVLIVEESADRSKLTAGQRSALFGGTIRAWLNSKCPVGPDGKQKEWFILDKDDDVSALAPHWQAAMKRPRQSYPWLIVSNGKTGFEGPLPASLDDTMKTLKQFGGE